MLWMTNVAAPYRVTVWDILHQRGNLEVLTLAENEWNRQWAGLSESRPYIRRLKSIGLRRGEHTHYFLRERLRMSAIDDCVVVGGWESPAFWSARKAGRASGLPVLGFYESTRATQRYSRGPLARTRERFFRSLDGVLVPGSRAEEAVVDMGVEPQRVFVTGNPVDNSRIFMEAVARRERSVAVEGRPHRFLYVGQLIARKNVSSVIKALADVEGSELVIAGGGQQATHLAGLVERLGLGRRVSFVGVLSVDEVLTQLAAAHTLVLASTEEVWGLVVNEALASGANVVVSDQCGVTPEVAHVPGVFVCAPSVDGLRAAMRLAVASWQGWAGAERLSLLPSPERFADVVQEVVDRLR